MTTGELPGPVDPMAPGPAAPTETPASAASPASAADAAVLLDPRPLRWIVFPLLMMMATFLRFLSLPARGMFDADQGRDFLVLRSMLVDGVFPLLGPPASIGGIHHGAAYYYLLAPLAWLSGLDPTVVAILFAAAGTATVALVWWLGRAVGGPIAGLVAGLVYALSPTAIAASITNWNPNLIGLTASLALAAAWKAWTSGGGRWWVLALGAAGLTVQLHVISVLFVLPVVGLLVADIRRTPAGPARRARVRAAVGGAVVVAALFVPLLVHELTTGFAEVRALMAFLATDRGPVALDPLSRLLIVVLRMASWPVVGLIVDAPVAASLLAGLVIAFCFWRSRAATGDERTATRWLVTILAISAVGLTLLVPDLARVVRGLPNDHYHAFTDPIIAVILGLGVAGILGPRQVQRRGGLRIFRAERILASAGLVVILVFELIHVPPRADPNGGWPAAMAAAERVARVTPAHTILIMGLPDFKPTAGFIFPLRQVGREVVDGQRAAQGHQAVDGTDSGGAGKPEALVVVCDRLFEPVLKAPCGGPAEELLAHEEFPRLVDRFDLSARTSISVYLPWDAAGS